jgi:hypothetical protein
MDGPFFSIFPYPSMPGVHSLTHVRYTPHVSWLDTGDEVAWQKVVKKPQHSSFEKMRRDAQRYVPELRDMEYLGSMFEVKTLLVHNEVDDGRPIYLGMPSDAPNFFSILGGKLDNVFDILARLDEVEIKSLT